LPGRAAHLDPGLRDRLGAGGIEGQQRYRQVGGSE
jgi:hypothetical protein